MDYMLWREACWYCKWQKRTRSGLGQGYLKREYKANEKDLWERWIRECE